MIFLVGVRMLTSTRFGASHRLQVLLDRTYVKPVGPYQWAWGDTKDRPRHFLKTPDRLLSEDSGLARFDQYYMCEDEFKLLALVIAVEARTKHGIVNTPPALLDESFRNSFAGG